MKSLTLEVMTIPRGNLNRRTALTFLALATGLAEAQAKTIVLAISTNAYASVQGKWLVLIYTEAFRRVGYTLKIEPLPLSRAELLSDSGALDGEMTKISTYGDSHPNMIRLGTPHFSAGFVAYAAKPTIRLKDGWRSLQGTQYRVDYRLGDKAPFEALTPIVDASQLSTVASVQSGLKKLLVDHSDVYIDLENTIESVLRSNEMTAEQARRLPFALHKVATMESFETYCFLHKKNSNLIEPLTSVLRQMKAEGTVAQYRKQAYLDFYGD